MHLFFSPKALKSPKNSSWFASQSLGSEGDWLRSDKSESKELGDAGDSGAGSTVSESSVSVSKIRTFKPYTVASQAGWWRHSVQVPGTRHSVAQMLRLTIKIISHLLNPLISLLVIVQALVILECLSWQPLAAMITSKPWRCCSRCCYMCHFVGGLQLINSFFSGSVYRAGTGTHKF